VYEKRGASSTYRGMPSAERKKRVIDAFGARGMSHRNQAYPSQLSGGQQQRVAVARAFRWRSFHSAGGRAHRKPGLGEWRSLMDLLRELHRGGATICM